MRAMLVGFLLCGVASAGGWRLMMSPGPVHQSHDSFAENCDACHLVFDGIPDAKCLDCHEGIALKLSGNIGFHGTQEGACIDCHGDHHGLDGHLTKEVARAAFTHDQTGFSLHGAHEGVGCEDCHTGPLEEVAARCATCHEDSHHSALGPACESCHQPTGWEEGLKTASMHTLSMEGKHAEQDCADCHTHGEHLSGDVSCGACHEQSHGGTELACSNCHEVTGFTPASFDHGPCTCAFPGKHQTVECLACHEDFVFTPTPHTCAGCHDEERPHDDLGACSQCHTATSWTENRFDHRKTSFPITGAHTEVSCAQCHTETRHFGRPGVEATGVIQVFSGQSTDCAGCHQASGDAAHGDFGACETCHTVDGFTPSSFDHAATGFVLTGRHADTNCQACHAEKVTGYPGAHP